MDSGSGGVYIWGGEKEGKVEGERRRKGKGRKEKERDGKLRPTVA